MLKSDALNGLIPTGFNVRYCVSPSGNIVKFVIAQFLVVEVNIEI